MKPETSLDKRDIKGLSLLLSPVGSKVVHNMRGFIQYKSNKHEALPYSVSHSRIPLAVEISNATLSNTQHLDCCVECVRVGHTYRSRK